MFEREIVKVLVKRISEPRHFIQILKGPRQTGKTTALLQLEQKISIPVLSVEASIDAASRDWVRAQWVLAREAAKESAEALLIIDEIQLVPQWSSVVKQLWDEDTRNKTNLKVILSGSSSLLLEAGLSEALTGRFETIHCTHWSYSECKQAFNYSFDDFLYFGGYPASALLKDDHDRWLDYMENSIIVPSITKDVISLEQVRKPALMEKLFWIASSFSSQEISYRKIMGQLDDAGNPTTLAHYVQLLDKASLLSGLQKYAKKDLQTRASSPKFITYDTSLMVATYGQYRSFLLSDPQRRGRLIESAVGAHLLAESKHRNFKVYWWREGNDEVDFVLQKGSRVVALEVKSGRVKPTTGMTRFINTFKPSKCLVVGSSECPTEAFLANKIDVFNV